MTHNYRIGEAPSIDTPSPWIRGQCDCTKLRETSNIQYPPQPTCPFNATPKKERYFAPLVRGVAPFAHPAAPAAPVSAPTAAGRGQKTHDVLSPPPLIQRRLVRIKAGVRLLQGVRSRLSQPQVVRSRSVAAGVIEIIYQIYECLEVLLLHRTNSINLPASRGPPKTQLPSL